MSKEHGAVMPESWTNALEARAKLLHNLILSLEKWVQETGGGSELLDRVTAPYYNLLRSLYQEDFPLAKAVETSDLLVHLEGPAFQQDTPKVSVITSVFSNVRREIARLAHTLAGTPEDQHRIPRQMDLGLAAFAKGSLYMGFKVSPESTEPQMSLLEIDEKLVAAAREAIQTIGSVVKGLNEEVTLEKAASIVPDPRVRDATLIAVERLAPTGKKGISAIEISGKHMPDRGFRRLTPEIRKMVRYWVEKPVRGEEVATFSGVVREIDLDARRFEIRRLHEAAPIGYVRCVYGLSFEKRAQRLLDRHVKVKGKVERTANGKPKLLQVEEVEVT